MKFINEKIKIIKKEKYVFLSIIASFAIAFSAMNDSFADKNIPQAIFDDVELAKNQLIETITDFSLDKTDSAYIKKRCDNEVYNVGMSEKKYFKDQPELFERQVQYDKVLNAVLPNDPCDYRYFNFINHDYSDFPDFTKHWHTGVVLHELGNIDTVSGTYDMTFQYYVEVFDKNDTSTNFKVKPPKIDFVNAIGDPTIELTKAFNQTKYYYDITVSGTFYTKINFEQFPFEKLNLMIITEPNYDKDSSSSFGYDDSQKDSIQLHIWPYYGLINPDIPTRGFKIQSYEFSTENYKRDYGDEYSRYIANYKVERYFADSFLKFIFPILVMTGLAFMSLLFPSEQYMTKISLNALFLLGILLFVQSVQEKLPNVGTLTSFDYVVMSSYAVLILTIAIPALKWKKLKRFEDLKVQRDIWIDTDRRNYDINLENLRRTEADIEFFKDKLSEHEEDSSEHKRLKAVIGHLKERRQALDTLKNIDSQISLFARNRSNFCASKINDADIQTFIHVQEDYKPNKETPGEKRLQIPTSWIMTKNIFTPEEIRYMLSKFKDEHYLEHLSQNERNDLENVGNQLKKYDDIKNNTGIKNRFVALQVQLPFLNRAWNKSGDTIKQEMMLMINKDGTSIQIFSLQEKRKELVKKLREIELITEDENDEMPIVDSEILNSDVRYAISKNELDERVSIYRYNKKLNYVAFTFIALICIVAVFFVKYLF